MADKHTVMHSCPRRLELGGKPLGLPDKWLKEAREYKICNYCGSLHPDNFMEMVEKGYVIGPTDKNYKVYVDKMVDERLCRVGKFYFQHLSMPQRQKFVELYNDSKIVFDSPGYLYVPPYFTKPQLPGMRSS